MCAPRLRAAERADDGGECHRVDEEDHEMRDRRALVARKGPSRVLVGDRPLWVRPLELAYLSQVANVHREEDDEEEERYCLYLRRARACIHGACTRGVRVHIA